MGTTITGRVLARTWTRNRTTIINLEQLQWHSTTGIEKYYQQYGLEIKPLQQHGL